MAEFDITGETNLSATGGNNYLHANAAIQAALRMVHKVLPKAVTAGANTITETELKENGTIRCTGTPGGAVTLTLDNNMGETPADQDRRLIIQNALSDTSVITVDTVTGSATTPPINQDEVWLIGIDANEIVLAVNLTGGGTTVFTGLTDTPSSFSGAGSQAVAVNSGATALEFVDFPAGGGGGGGAGSWEAIETISSSSVASYDFDLPGSGYRDFALIGWVQPATDGADLWFLVTTDGFSTVKTGASDYRWINDGRSSSGSAIADVDAADTEYRVLNSVGNGASEMARIAVQVGEPANTSFPTIFSGLATWVTAANTNPTIMTGGSYVATTAVDGIRVQFSSGNIASGSLTLYGLKTDLPDVSAKTVAEIDVAAGGTITLTDAQIRGADFLKLTGAPAGAFTLDVPDGDRRYIIWNASGQSATVDTVTGSATTITVANGERWQIQQDGIEMVAKHQLSAP